MSYYARAVLILSSSSLSSYYLLPYNKHKEDKYKQLLKHINSACEQGFFLPCHLHITFEKKPYTYLSMSCFGLNRIFLNLVLCHSVR